MTILCDQDIEKLIWDEKLVDPFNYDHLNPASYDICVGRNIIIEVAYGHREKMVMTDAGWSIRPGEFVLLDTMETFNVPNGYAMDLRLKSSTARLGWDHSLAFWVDPGWQGVLTMEVKNLNQYNPLVLVPGQRFAQIVVHKLSGLSRTPYQGRYKGATSVEGAKE